MREDLNQKRMAAVAANRKTQSKNDVSVEIVGVPEIKESPK